MKHAAPRHFTVELEPKAYYKKPTRVVGGRCSLCASIHIDPSYPQSLAVTEQFAEITFVSSIMQLVASAALRRGDLNDGVVVLDTVFIIP